MASELKGCQFLLETGASHDLYDQLDARALDVIVSAQLGDRADWTEVHPVLREPFVVVAPRGVIRRDRDLLRQLKRLPLIQYTQRHYMGRLISAHLARAELSIPYRFELDSYHSILALVGQGTGWSILTPLALMRARRFDDQIDVLELPMEPLTRTIAVTARKGILQDMPATLAARLKPVLQETIVTPVIAAHPFLAGGVTVL
jgi:DNA-binding transcriptional LysR family regulator